MLQADVFSFGVVCYELLHRRLILSSILEKNFGASARVLESATVEYASSVAAGFRPPLSPRLPDSLRCLIEGCWHDDPSKRPSMKQVCRRLYERLLMSYIPLVGQWDGCNWHQVLLELLILFTNYWSCSPTTDLVHQLTTYTTLIFTKGIWKLYNIMRFCSATLFSDSNTVFLFHNFLLHPFRLLKSLRVSWSRRKHWRPWTRSRKEWAARAVQFLNQPTAYIDINYYTVTSHH